MGAGRCDRSPSHSLSGCGTLPLAGDRLADSDARGGLGAPVYELPELGWIEFASGGTGENIVFNVADCHDACRELRRRGVACDDPVVFPGYVTFCSFYDPFGNRLQMCSPAPEAKPGEPREAG